MIKDRYVSMFVVSKDMPIITVGISTECDPANHEHISIAAAKAKEIYNQVFPELPYSNVITKWEQSYET